jgi:hypothetical protein
MLRNTDVELDIICYLCTWGVMCGIYKMLFELKYVVILHGSYPLDKGAPQAPEIRWGSRKFIGSSVSSNTGKGKWPVSRILVSPLLQ